MKSVPPTIATWFVSDSKEDGTFFPQVGARSDSAIAQAVYWRCTMVFFASSLAHNPGARHVLYTNTVVPQVDGVDLAAVLDRWGVAVVHQPITWRLPRGSVSRWGNQFYVFDVMEHHAAEGAGSLLLLDSDCVFMEPADALFAGIDRHGALTYRLDDNVYTPDTDMNGQTEAGLAHFVARHGGPQRDAVNYCGGEFYAATAQTNRAIAERARALWPDVIDQGSDAPREEAHLLSAIYALEGFEIGTGNPFIRRMWTSFKFHTLTPSDRDITIWHLPVEKKTGFADLWHQMVSQGMPEPRLGTAKLGLDFANVAKAMGWPRRGVRKLGRDLTLKLREKLAG